MYNDEYELVEVTEKELNENNLLKGDVLFIRSSVKPSGVGLPCVIMEDMKDTVFSGFIIRCRFINNIEIDINYKKYCFLEKDFRKNLLIRSSSSANTNINQDNLSVIKVKLPCVEEQEKIASFLTSIDNLISTQESNISILETYNRGLISKIFKQEIRFKDANGNEFPDWTEKTFEELADYKKGPFGSALKKEIFVPKSNTTKKVYEQQHAIEKDCTIERYFITDKYYEKMKSFSVKKGDIIISCAGTIGEIYVLPSNAEDGIINQALMRVRINNNVIDQKFFITLFDNMISTKGKKLSNGSALKNIPPFADLKKQIALVPCLEEQQKIANCLSAIDKVVEQEKVYLEQLKTIKKGLLQQMFV